MKNEPIVLKALVDRLVEVNAAKAALEKEEKAIKEALVNSGLDVVEGSKNKAVISAVAESVVVSWKDVAAAMGAIPPKLVKKFSKPKAGYFAVKLYSM